MQKSRNNENKRKSRPGSGKKSICIFNRSFVCVCARQIVCLMSPARLFLFLLSLEFIQIFFSHFFLIFKKTGIAVSCLFNDSSHVHRRGRRVIYSFNPPRSALSGCKRRSGIIRPGSHSVRMSMNVVNERIKVNLSNWMKNFIQFPMKFVSRPALT